MTTQKPTSRPMTKEAAKRIQRAVDKKASPTASQKGVKVRAMRAADKKGR